MKKIKVYFLVNSLKNTDWKCDPTIETFTDFADANCHFADLLKEVYLNWAEEYGEENIVHVSEEGIEGNGVVNYETNADSDTKSIPYFEIYDIRDSVRKYQKIYLCETTIEVPDMDVKKKSKKKTNSSRTKQEVDAKK